MRLKEIKRDNTFKQHFVERIVVDPVLMVLFEEQLAIFIKDRSNSGLRDHALSWGMQGLRAFSITKDIRVIYEETSAAYILRDIGTHGQVYK